ncbi:MAG TPA: sulfurtransferase-like selenium metabolism protein YedF [Holophaga sp.]|nr:sulfurtransferase-like selenium metabolism protein YedF [Holophaga sp.]
MSHAPRIIDARGLACPQPVILTRKALAEGGCGLLVVMVDNPASRENVVRFATHAGCAVEGVEEAGNEARITIRPTGAPAALPPAEASCDAPELPRLDPSIRTVFLSGRTLGRGDDELGALLMRAFLYTLTESDIVPQRLLLMNGGVLLAIEGSEHLVNLKRLADLGVEILACGTCLEFYKVKEKLAVGRVSNMQEIAGFLLEGNALSL